MFGIPICCGKLMTKVGTVYVTVTNFLGKSKKVKKTQYYCRQCGNYRNV